jgi:hypothetical protein
MNTRRTKPAPTHPHRIYTTSVYFYRDVQLLLRLPEAACREEIAAGRLRVSEAQGRYRFLGRWLIEWIEANERSSKPAKPASRQPASAVNSPATAREG